MQRKKPLWQRLLLSAGIALTVGVAFYAVAKFAGGYVPQLTWIVPVMDDLAAKAYGLFQSGLGTVAGVVTTIGGIFLAIRRNRETVNATTTEIKEEVQQMRASSESQIADVKAEGEAAIGELKGQVESVTAEKQTILNDFNAYKLSSQEQLSKVQIDAKATETQLKMTQAENERLWSQLEAFGVKRRETDAGTQGV